MFVAGHTKLGYWQYWTPDYNWCANIENARLFNTKIEVDDEIKNSGESISGRGIARVEVLEIGKCNKKEKRK